MKRWNRTQRQNEEGFTLIELLIVMSVMLILMTLAVPQMLKLMKQAHQTSALASIRAIAQAELQYNSTYPANGFACTLIGSRGAARIGSTDGTECADDSTGSGVGAEGGLHLCHQQLHQGDREQPGYVYVVPDHGSATVAR